VYVDPFRTDIFSAVECEILQDSPEEPWPDLLVDRRPIQEKRVWRSRDPVELERNNLVAIR
jgi:hypothetical protein